MNPDATLFPSSPFSMKQYQQLVRFINRVVLDDRLTPVHISLSLALCHHWMLNQFHRSYQISRSRLMKASRIRPKATYHKVIKELQQFGYLKYTPSNDPVNASEVMIVSGEVKEQSNGRK